MTYMGLYFGIIIIIIAVIGLLCNFFYMKGYKDCFRDQEKNKKFGKNIDSLKCYIVDSQKK